MPVQSDEPTLQKSRKWKREEGKSSIPAFEDLRVQGLGELRSLGGGVEIQGGLRRAFGLYGFREPLVLGLQVLSIQV